MLGQSYPPTPRIVEADLIVSWSVFFVQLLATKEAVYLSGMTTSTASYTLHLASITIDGVTIRNLELPHTVEHPSAFSFLTYTPDDSKTSTHSLIMLEGSKIKHIKLNADLSQRKKATKLSDTYTSLYSFGCQFNGHAVGQKEDGTAHILRLRADGAITDAWTFTGSNYDSYTGSPPLFSAGIDKDGKVYVSRTVWSFNMNMGSMTVYSDGPDGRGLEHGITFPFKPADQGVMLHVRGYPQLAINLADEFFLSGCFGCIQPTSNDGQSAICDLDFPRRLPTMGPGVPQGIFAAPLG
jgi:hypothetical protein